MAESLCCSPETTTSLLIGYTPIQNVFGVFKKKKKQVGKAETLTVRCLSIKVFRVLNHRCNQGIELSHHPQRSFLLVLCRQHLPHPSLWKAQIWFCPYGFAFSKVLKWNGAARSLSCLALSLGLTHLRLTQDDMCICS